jgi:hypothetical protein
MPAMSEKDRDRRFDEIKRCLAEADSAFARAGAVTDDHDRLRLIDEAEAWLTRAERRLARLTGRTIPPARPDVAVGEGRSFGDQRPPHRSLVWRRTPS